ncbi:related to WD40-repeat protein (notchless protein) [Serendipita indica DSM 11827]|uniref:Related to WD40-repeat protein (Notchless protein) n=1 Tax=Serendipita indica (strain DSM 11827) TaxID=1109443 RepID=G4TWE3_SERID|nr:related to WD40-repeat protein (notchless protein) [Serendipita indica DSM 11827]
MCEMLAVFLVAFEPLTVDDLEDLFTHVGAHGSARGLIQNLGSVFIEDQTTHLVQFRHPTLVEYLRRRTRATTPEIGGRVHLDIVRAHGQAASWCLKCFKSPSGGLKFNICQIESSFYLNRQILDLDTRVSRYISGRLRYASSHWSFHVAETNDEWRHALRKELQDVIKSPCVLYWMEILSVTGGLSRAIDGLRSVTRHTSLEDQTKVRMTEIRRFMMAFSVPIQESAPHIYLSALPFSPKASNLHTKGLARYKKTLIVIQGLEETYRGLPRAILHEDSVNAIAFSPDGSRIASASSDKAIRIWDADTGQLIGKPLRGHKLEVNAVAFSPDGSRIVSGSDDATIRLWRADNGQPIGQPLRGHDRSVRAVAFSPDGLRIASGSDDKTVRIWDAATGQLMGEPLVGHDGYVNAVSYAPDGSRIASGSDDGTIQIWRLPGDCYPDYEDNNTLHSSLEESNITSKSLGALLPIVLPGFRKCFLLQDGWVQSSDQFLFWVPPDNRHGLRYPCHLSIPPRAHLRKTRIDFANFRCGTDWTEVCTG